MDRLIGQPYWTALLDSLIEQPHFIEETYKSNSTGISHNVGFSRNHNARYAGNRYNVLQDFRFHFIKRATLPRSRSEWPFDQA